MQNSLCVQVCRSPTLAALLHGTPAAGLSQTLRCGTRNGITELSQTAPPIFGQAAIRLGIGPHSSVCMYHTVYLLSGILHLNPFPNLFQFITFFILILAQILVFSSFLTTLSYTRQGAYLQYIAAYFYISRES